jgi:hypothetical protein
MIGHFGDTLMWLKLFRVQGVQLETHLQMNAAHFGKWGAKKLMTCLPPHSVIALDNTLNHFFQTDKPLSYYKGKNGEL